MSLEGELMRKALKKVLLPELNRIGFTGTSSNFQRRSAENLDLLSIEYWKYGGQFILEFARSKRGALNTSWGEVVQEEKIGVAHISPLQRARLQRTLEASEDLFRGFKFSGFGEDLAKYIALAHEVAALLPQVNAWLESGAAGENIHTLGRGA
jgi:hypothetical protein